MDPKSIAKMMVDSEEPADMDFEDDGEEMDEGLEVAADEMLQALEMKDPKSFARALKSFMRMC